MNEIRVIAPSDSWKVKREGSYTRARERFEEAGYRISYSQNIKSLLHLGTASAKLRAEDFNNAFADKNVSAVIALHGGFSANEILPLINWDIVKNNPKPLIGYSDITVLVNAVHAKTGNTAFLGPNFGTNGYEDLWQYSIEGVLKVLSGQTSYTLHASKKHIDDDAIHISKPWNVLQKGTGEGKLLGGNIQSFFLLQGTEYLPKFDCDYILAIEDDSLSKEYTLHGLSRNLESILQLPGARKNIKGILIGRFELASKVSDSDLRSVISSKSLEVPVVSNVDFGHTTPMATLPIGGTLSIEALTNTPVIKVISY
ncbi:MAG TPA: S66 peptidase family protein [Candidatus Saccharimonadales bacterium]|jgi:muramoyltetrapeptide carboxypeptidase LdcA involved in peptidoglycan recycling